MPYEFFDHTGDVGVRLSGASVEDLFEAAALAFADTLTVRAAIVARGAQPVGLEADGADLLLVDWLSELLYRFEVQRWLPCAAAVTVNASGGRWRLDARVQGEVFDPARHPIKVLVKAVTYHALAVEQTPDGRWQGTVVFDV
jgi:SHS2 domain-containing protein